jgi:radical SAM protein with 4Fe4S-binding SPASM domain
VQESGDARALVESRGFKFQYALDLIAKTDGDLSPLQYRLTPAEKVRVGREIGFTPKPLIPADCRLGGGSFIECACGRSRFAVTPYGEMNLCIAFPIPKYDLRKGTVKDGWEVLKRTVDEARPSDRYACPTCEVRPYCRQGRNDAWLETGEMSPCLPHYHEWATLEKSLHELRDV